MIPMGSGVCCGPEARRAAGARPECGPGKHHSPHASYVGYILHTEETS